MKEYFFRFYVSQDGHGKVATGIVQMRAKRPDQVVKRIQTERIGMKGNLLGGLPEKYKGLGMNIEFLYSVYNSMQRVPDPIGEDLDDLGTMIL